MPFKTPQQTTAAAVTVGAAKAAQPLNRTLVGGFLAGAYIAFGGLVSISVSSGLDPKTWGTLPTLISGSVFALGLILVVLAGSDLLTGNMALVPTALFRRKVKIGRLSVNFAILFIANLLGSLFVAYFLAVKSGVIGSHGADPASASGLTFARLSGIAKAKTITESDYQIFLRGMGCNWLVCLAVWLAIAAEDVAGKILGIFFPIMAFVAMGFDHVVANMFFLPAAMFAHVPGITWGGVVNNWFWAFLGNLVGAVIFVATFYWYLHLRGQPDLAPAIAAPHPRRSPEQERTPTPVPPTADATP
ncbi:MAG: formate/nitrite transporter family protein [Mycobacterium sp.]